MKKNKFLWISLILFFGGLLITVLPGFMSYDNRDYVVFYASYIAFGVSILGLNGVLIEFVIGIVERFKGLRKHKVIDNPKEEK